MNDRLLLLLLLVFSLRATIKDKIKFIEVRKIDFSMMGVVPVYCDIFDQQTYMIDTFIITDLNKISFIVKDLKSASVAPEYNGLDTRAKIIIHYQSGKKDSACIAATGVFYYHDQTMLFKDRRTVNLIDSLPMKEEW